MPKIEEKPTVAVAEKTEYTVLKSFYLDRVFIDKSEKGKFSKNELSNAQVKKLKAKSLIK